MTNRPSPWPPQPHRSIRPPVDDAEPLAAEPVSTPTADDADDAAEHDAD